MRGFTLIELLVTLSVIGIIMAIAVPNLRDFIVSTRLSSNVNSFVGLVSYARSEAIVRNKQVIICAKNNSGNTCATTDEWEKFETQIFVDEDGSDSFNTGDTLLKIIPAIDVTGDQFRFSKIGSSPNLIKFQSGGFGTGLFHFKLYAVNASDTAYETKYGRSICISRPGRARVLGLIGGTTCP